ncbi:MAG TPA: hypothetical protein VK450_01705, partial [Methanomicrobiales archaeon]|nr:hypothetical protein [Methanomicrobiales archaeon]
VLDRLMGKNLVAVSHGAPRRYSAIPPGEGIENLLSRIEGDARRAKEVLSEIYRKRVTVERGEQELIWSIHGEEKIVPRLRDLIRGAGKRVQVSTSGPFLEKTLLPCLRELPESVGVEVVTSRWRGPVPRGMKVHVRPLPGGPRRQLPTGTAGIFLIDGEKAMVVMGISGEAPTALFSESPGFLRFFSQIWSLNLAYATRRDTEARPGAPRKSRA